MKKIALTAILATVLLSACGKQEEIHDVAYYKNNPQAYKEQNAKCANNPGELKDTPNCVNVAQAYREIKQEIDEERHKYSKNCGVVGLCPEWEQRKQDETIKRKLEILNN